MDNKENVYNTQIKKKLEEIAKICYLNSMPCFFAVAVGDKEKKRKEENVEGKLELKVTTYLPQMLHMETPDTIFSDFVDVINGFTTVPPTDRSNFELNMDDLSLPPDLGQTDIDISIGD